MAEPRDLNGKYMTRDLCSVNIKLQNTKLEQIKIDLVEADEKLEKILSAVNPTKEVAHDNKRRLDEMDKSKERRRDSSWKFWGMMCAFFGGMKGLMWIVGEIAKRL